MVRPDGFRHERGKESEHDSKNVEIFHVFLMCLSLNEDFILCRMYSIQVWEYLV
jgi:hypothetical protein